MPKRKSSDELYGGGSVNKRRPVAALECKQHLYLLLDDWERGYSVHRLDVDAFDPDVADDDHPPPERFTEPPVARLEADHTSGSNFVSHGTRIFAMQPGEGSPAIPAFDTRTLGLSICPWPSSARDYVLPFFASAAGRLLVVPDDTRAVYQLGGSNKAAARWSWTAVETRAPFYASKVTCYALHPDGRTLFVSASLSRGRGGTFSLDTERLEWTRHGDWLLPFSGQAYFDAELEGWVGLCGERGGAAGRLCACDVVGTGGPPSWKLGEEIRSCICESPDFPKRITGSLYYRDSPWIGRNPIQNAS